MFWGRLAELLQQQGEAAGPSAHAAAAHAAAASAPPAPPQSAGDAGASGSSSGNSSSASSSIGSSSSSGSSRGGGGGDVPVPASSQFAAAAPPQQEQPPPQQRPAPPAADDPKRLEYLEQRYGGEQSHVYLTREQTEGILDRVLAESAPVKYLLESLKLGGCGVGRSFFHVTSCDENVGGGFSTDYGVILCHNRLFHYREVELAVAHELIHAYDFCRASNLDLTNCHHHACTEIRAANLSGDCTFLQEYARGNVLSESIVGQQKRCVRRRALMSVAMNPYCAGAKAEQAVAEMMPKCFKDTDPWPRVPGL